MEKNLEEIKDAMAEFIENADKRVAGVKVAGARSRKTSIHLTKLLKKWRKLSL